MSLAAQLDDAGYARLPAAWDATACLSAVDALERIGAAGGDGVLRTRRGVYGLRHVERLWPELAAELRASPLAATLRALLGDDALLVRAILFDKPPGQGWGVDWHRDQSIAVRAHTPAPPGYQRPTVKHGVPHLDAPSPLLDRMLIARVHLDPASTANGALQVLPGSHREADLSDAAIADRVAAGAADTIVAAVGEALLMRPRLYHASSPPPTPTTAHRRVLHLECAPAAALPPPLTWACRVPLRD